MCLPLTSAIRFIQFLWLVCMTVVHIWIQETSIFHAPLEVLAFSHFSYELPLWFQVRRCSSKGWISKSTAGYVISQFRKSQSRGPNSCRMLRSTTKSYVLVTSTMWYFYLTYLSLRSLEVVHVKNCCELIRVGKHFHRFEWQWCQWFAGVQPSCQN